MYIKTDMINTRSIKTLYMIFDRKLTELEVVVVKFSEKIQFNIWQKRLLACASTSSVSTPTSGYMHELKFFYM